jgi:hypothetical protein
MCKQRIVARVYRKLKLMSLACNCGCTMSMEIWCISVCDLVTSPVVGRGLSFPLTGKLAQNYRPPTCPCVGAHLDTWQCHVQPSHSLVFFSMRHCDSSRTPTSIERTRDIFSSAAMDLHEVQAQVTDWLNEASVTFQKVPGSAVLIRYVRSSYQNDPIRSAIELVLFIFFIRYLLSPSYSTSKQNFIKLSEDVGWRPSCGCRVLLTGGRKSTSWWTNGRPTPWSLPKRRWKRQRWRSCQW